MNLPCCCAHYLVVLFVQFGSKLAKIKTWPTCYPPILLFRYTTFYILLSLKTLPSLPSPHIFLPPHLFFLIICRRRLGIWRQFTWTLPTHNEELWQLIKKIISHLATMRNWSISLSVSEWWGWYTSTSRSVSHGALWVARTSLPLRSSSSSIISSSLEYIYKKRRF